MGLRGCIVAVLPLCACGDAPICESDVFVAIQTSHVTIDADAIAPGVQAEIRVRTSLAEGDSVALEAFGPGDSSLGVATALVDADGMAIFTGVTVVAPSTRMRASVDVFCGSATDELLVEVTAGIGCDLTFLPAPEPNAFYAPRDVLSKNTDPDPVTPDFQTTILVTTRPGFTVEIFETTKTGESSIATLTASSTEVQFARTVGQGEVSYRAVCNGSGNSTSSIAKALFVDTIGPSCLFAVPFPGTTITPAFDTNGDLDDGVQLQFVGLIDGTGDTEGESTELTVTPAGGTPVLFPTTLVDESSGTIAAVSLDPPTTPASFDFALSGRDHAGNTCLTTETFSAVFDGCDIAIVSPVATVIDDVDGNPTNGAQIDVLLQISSECVGLDVESSCSANGTVAGDGSATIRVSVCGTSPCEAAVPCTFQVTTTTGVTTSASTTLLYDDQGPPASVAIVNPVLACDSQITPATDADPITDGVQVVARVTSAGATSQRLDLTNSAGTTSFDATNDVTVTLEPGVNRFLGIGIDQFGNEGLGTDCTIILADINVSFAPPAADGVLSRADGTIAGNTITFPLCGTVSRTGTAVNLTIDGASPVPAVVTGTDWCRTVTLTESPPSHTIVATATAGSSFGSASLVLRVDLTAPPAVVNLVVVAPDRTELHLTWQSPSDGGQPVVSYLVKQAFAPITEANFDTTGTVLPTGAPGAPGTPEQFDIDPAITEAEYFFALATFDAAGNRTLAIPAPVKPSFVRTGAIVGPDPSAGQLALGTAIASGRFNDDDFDDLAVSAPTENSGATRAGAVYVYFGGPSGIGSVPDAILETTIAGSRLGSGLAAVQWTSSSRHDLVVGAPGRDSNRGRIFVFAGGVSFTAGSRDASTADFELFVDAAAPGFFAGSNLGTGLVRADVDGDGTDDLVASAPVGGGGIGGAIIVYGDTVTGDVALSDVSSAGANGAIVELFRDPGAVPNRRLGTYLHAVGPTESAIDATDDIVIAYLDIRASGDEAAFVLRSDGSRPTSPGVTDRSFTIGRDVKIEYITSTPRAEWAAHATTIDDRDGDGARDLVIAAYRASPVGQVLIVSGATVGTNGLARTTDPGVTLTTIDGPVNGKFGAMVLASDPVFDVDGDGLDDLFVVGVVNAVTTGFFWPGAAIPQGPTTFASAASRLTAPATFTLATNPSVAIGLAKFVGDLDGDGLGDVCWASPFDNGSDGSFEVLD